MKPPTFSGRVSLAGERSGTLKKQEERRVHLPEKESSALEVGGCLKKVDSLKTVIG